MRRFSIIAEQTTIAAKLPNRQKNFSPGICHPPPNYWGIQQPTILWYNQSVKQKQQTKML